MSEEDETPRTDPIPTIPHGMSAQRIAEAFVTEARRGDAVILRTLRSEPALDVELFVAGCRATLPGVDILVLDGTRVGVHVIRGGSR